MKIRISDRTPSESVDDVSSYDYDDNGKYRSTRELKMGLWVLTAVVVCVLMHFTHNIGELRQQISELDDRVTQKLSSGLKSHSVKSQARLTDPERRIKELEDKLLILEKQGAGTVKDVNKLPSLEKEIKVCVRVILFNC